jgi:2-polyprenyl-3-methyl-5-hydroxy-6-metoxy-1,4-benzoquinol methylase
VKEASLITIRPFARIFVSRERAKPGISRLIISVPYPYPHGGDEYMAGSKLIDHAEVQCPICKTITAPDRSTRHFDPIGSQEYSILTCKNCEGMFSCPMKNPGPLWYADFHKYFAADHGVVDKNDPYYKQVCANLKKVLGKFTGKSPEYLDIGCGHGYFLAEARKMGFSVHGIDFDPNRVIFANKMLGGNIVEQTDIDLIDGSRPAYDVVSFYGFLEHVDDPNAFMKKVNGILKMNGYIIFDVPNSERLLPSALGITDCPPHHLTKFNLRSIKCLLDLSGYRIVSEESNSYPIKIFYTNMFISLISWSSKYYRTVFKKETQYRVPQKAAADAHPGAVVSNNEDFFNKFKRFAINLVRLVFMYILLPATILFVYPYVVFMRNRGKGGGIHITAQKIAEVKK